MAHGHGGRRPGAGRKPGRLSKAKKHIAEQAATYGPAALQVLLEIAQDPDAPASSRVSAANAILDRGYGRPTAPLDFEPKEDRIGEILREIQERGSRLQMVQS